MRQGKVAGFRWQVEMENPEIPLLFGENGLKNQKANPVGVRCKKIWSGKQDSFFCSRDLLSKSAQYSHCKTLMLVNIFMFLYGTANVM